MLKHLGIIKDSDIGKKGNIGHHHFLLVKDTLQAEGSWILHEFISAYLRSGKNVLLLGLEQNLFHYTTVQKKLGINLINEHSKGSFLFVDGFSNLSGWRKSETLNDKTIPFSFKSSDSLFSLFRLLRECTEKLQQTHPGGILLVIDHLSLLVNYSQNISEALQFVQYLHSLILRMDSSSSLLFLVHSQDFQDSHLQPYEPENCFIQRVLYQSDLIFECEELETGKAKEIEGKVNLFFNGKEIIENQEKMNSKILWKTNENQSHVFTINQI